MPHALALLAVASASAAQQTATVSPAAQYQTWDGWGTSLSWWAVVVGGWSEENRDQIADLLFDAEDGLGLNIVRYNISGQDDPSHDHMRIGSDPPGFWPAEDEPYDWSADAEQRAMLSEAIERGVNITEAFSCSPPYWMTVSGCSAGAEEAHQVNLREEHYETFADYLTEVVRHFRDEWGVEFTTLAPMNEPAAHYWKSAGFQQGCHFSRDKQNRLLRLLAARLREKGLSTELSASDETCTEHCVQSLRAYDDDVRDAVGQVNTHTYSYSYDRRGPRYLADLFGKRLYMSEICFASRSPGKEHDHDSVTGVLDLARAITRDLREMRPEGWVLWQSLTNELYSTWWEFNYGLIHSDYSSPAEEWDVMRKYYGYAQYTRFIRPGSRMIGVDADDAVAFMDGETLTLVAYNESDAERTREYDLTRFTSLGAEAESHRTCETEKLAALPAIALRDGRLTTVEPPQSVTTYIVSGASYEGGPEPPTVWLNDDAVGDGENQFNYTGDWQYTDNQPGAFVSDNHWSPNEGDSYTVRFTGIQALLYAALGAGHGIAAVSVDGGDEEPVDFYAPTRQDQALVYASPLLPLGEHTLTVRVTGQKNDQSAHTHIPADRVDIKKGSDPFFAP